MAERKLNRQQSLAIHHRRGPLLVVAGAGTGKTTIITERIKWLIKKKLAGLDEILALTFTDKAAKEMEDRLDLALPYGYTQTWVMTFHSFCDRVLRDECLHIGLSPNYKLLTGSGVVSLLRRHLFSPDLNLNYFRPLGNPNKFIFGLLDHFDRLRDEDVSPDQYAAWVNKTYPQLDSPQAMEAHELSSAFTWFQQLKIQENSLDFADLISYTLALFRTRPHLLAKYQHRFKYILVDEYQDTNYAQNQLVDILAGNSRNLTVVADDDQSIYRWRGAAVSNVIRFRDIYPDAKLVVLTQNYRSTQTILDTAYRLICFNNPDRLEVREHLDKHLHSVSGGSGITPEYLHFSRAEDEADGIAKKISELLSADPKLHPKDIAVLVRANAHAQPFLASLTKWGIPAQFLGQSKLFDQPEVKDLIAFLRVINDPTDSASFFRILSMTFFAVPPRDLITVSNFAKKQNQTLLETCENLHSSELKLSPAGRKSISALTKLINSQIEKSLSLTAGQILFNFLHDSGLLSAVLKFTLPLGQREAENISLFFSQLKNYEFENSDASVSSVLDWIELAYESGNSPPVGDADRVEDDAVNLLTLHSAKGLEFPVIFLVNLVVGRFPSLERSEQIPIPDELIKEILPQGDFHLQEERRLFYVGLTRAKQQLFLSSADYYGEGKRVRRASPFISEALGSEVLFSSPVARQLPLSDWQPQLSHSETRKPSRTKQPVTYLSYSQIATFNDCPLHYKAKYLLKIPSPASAASSFGNTIHKTLKDYYLFQSSGEKPDILQIYSQNWTPEGYLNAKHAQKYFDLGTRYVSEFTSKNPFTTTPVILEQPFTFHLQDLKIGGKIDRADILPDGTLEIIDYKTSPKMLDPKSAAKDLQLSFYALAATTIRTPPFNRRPEQVKLTLYYFDQQQAVSVVQSAAQLEAAKQEILATAKKIRESDFHCSGSIICRDKCDYKILCDVYLNQ
jgi:DNA helicase-2/ATP-dependent DNA helicase PcrA